MAIITHITSLHPRNDIRVYQKMCKWLSKKNEVNLIVADGLGDQKIGKVSIIDAGLREPKRFFRFFITTFKIIKKALITKSDLYHLHDPELIYLGIFLKFFNSKVIYDSHEDLPKQIISKTYLSNYQKKIFYYLAYFYEWFFYRFFDGLICATESIASRRKFLNSNVSIINNYPILKKIRNTNTNTTKKKNIIIYFGGISHIRGIESLVESVKYLSGIEIHIAGNFSDQKFKEKLLKNDNWNKIFYHGHLSGKELSKLINKSTIGIVPFLNVPNHFEAKPNKFYEYMLHGLPVLASDLPAWKDFIKKFKCGLVFKCGDPKDIAIKIVKIFSNKKLISIMATNGRNAIKSNFNWANEFSKLNDFYDKILYY